MSCRLGCPVESFLVGMQERWNVPNAEYVQPKAKAPADQHLNGNTTQANGGDVHDAPAKQQVNRSARPSEGMNAEELWKPEASAKVCHCASFRICVNLRSSVCSQRRA